MADKKKAGSKRAAKKKAPAKKAPNAEDVIVTTAPTRVGGQRVEHEDGSIQHIGGHTVASPVLQIGRVAMYIADNVCFVPHDASADDLRDTVRVMFDHAAAADAKRAKMRFMSFQPGGAQVERPDLDGLGAD